MTARTDHVETLLRDTLAGQPFLVEKVEIHPAGKRRLVRVSVDRDLAALNLADDSSPVEPMTLDEVGEVTQAISKALDDDNPMGEAPYVLEVSSVGVDHPLTQPRHFRRNVGRLVAVTVDDEKVTGRIASAGDEHFTLETPADSGQTRSITYASVGKATIQVEFNRRDGKDN